MATILAPEADNSEERAWSKAGAKNVLKTYTISIVTLQSKSRQERYTVIRELHAELRLYLSEPHLNWGSVPGASHDRHSCESELLCSFIADAC